MLVKLAYTLQLKSKLSEFQPRPELGHLICPIIPCSTKKEALCLLTDKKLIKFVFEVLYLYYIVYKFVFVFEIVLKSPYRCCTRRW